jgi:hypothetical protein
MLSFLVLTAANVAHVSPNEMLPCEGIRIIEASTRDRPVAFSSLKVAAKESAYVRNAAGIRERREIDVTNVKALAGFSRCRFIYSATIDLACYIGTTLPDTDTTGIADKLSMTGESVGHCLTGTNLVRAESEVGSTPSILFGAGPRQSFWQISMVPSADDPSRIQPEVLVLGPAEVSPPPRPLRKATKAKRKSR